jgi:hypothetical protein
MPAGRKKKEDRHPALSASAEQWADFTEKQREFLYERQFTNTNAEAMRRTGISFHTMLYRDWWKVPGFKEAHEEAIQASIYSRGLDGKSLVREATILLADAMRGARQIDAQQLNAAKAILSQFKGVVAFEADTSYGRKARKRARMQGEDTGNVSGLSEVIGIPGIMSKNRAENN